MVCLSSNQRQEGHLFVFRFCLDRWLFCVSSACSPRVCWFSTRTPVSYRNCQNMTQVIRTFSGVCVSVCECFNFSLTLSLRSNGISVIMKIIMFSPGSVKKKNVIMTTSVICFVFLRVIFQTLHSINCDHSLSFMCCLSTAPVRYNLVKCPDRNYETDCKCKPLFSLSKPGQGPAAGRVWYRHCFQVNSRVKVLC